MNIVRMIGSLDGIDLIFRKDVGNLWVADVPKDFNGEYVVDITAFDEAGNSSYYASMLFTVDPKTLQVKIIPLNFRNETVKETYKDEAFFDYTFIETKDTYYENAEPFNFGFIIIDDKKQSKNITL